MCLNIRKFFPNLSSRKWTVSSHLNTKIGKFFICISLKIEEYDVGSPSTLSHLIFGYIQYILSRSGAKSFHKFAKIPPKLFHKNDKLMDQRLVRAGQGTVTTKVLLIYRHVSYYKLGILHWQSPSNSTHNTVILLSQ